MVNSNIKETDINRAKNWSGAVYLEDDLVLTERINEVPVPTEPLNMNFIIIGLCTKGEVMYQLDTIKQVIKPGDILVVSDRHIVDSYQHSEDMEGLCMVMSVNFFREIIKNVSDISSLFLFSRLHPVMSLEEEEIQTFKEYFQVIKEKIGDKRNHFQKDLIKSLLLAMFYDLSNIIYRVQNDVKPKSYFHKVHQTCGEALQARTPCKLVRQGTRHHAEISLGVCEIRQSSHSQRMDRLLYHTGTTGTTQEQY